MSQSHTSIIANTSPPTSDIVNISPPTTDTKLPAIIDDVSQVIIDTKPPVIINGRSWGSVASTVISVVTYPLRTKWGLKGAFVAGMYYGGAMVVPVVGIPTVIVASTIVLLL